MSVNSLRIAFPVLRCLLHSNGWKEGPFLVSIQYQTPQTGALFWNLSRKILPDGQRKWITMFSNNPTDWNLWLVIIQNVEGAFGGVLEIHVFAAHRSQAQIVEETHHLTIYLTPSPLLGQTPPVPPVGSMVFQIICKAIFFLKAKIIMFKQFALAKIWSTISHTLEKQKMCSLSNFIGKFSIPSDTKV